MAMRRQELTGRGGSAEEKEAGELWTPVTDGAAEAELWRVVSAGVAKPNKCVQEA